MPFVRHGTTVTARQLLAELLDEATRREFVMSTSGPGDAVMWTTAPCPSAPPVGLHQGALDDPHHHLVDRLPHGLAEVRPPVVH